MNISAGLLAAVMVIPIAPSSSTQTPTCFGETATILGTENDDSLRGTEGNDVIAGLAGNDILTGLEGDDRVCGGAGIDLLHGDEDCATSLGEDQLDGGRGLDILFADSCWFPATSETPADVVLGRAGGDFINAGPGDDTVDGGPGRDTFHIVSLTFASIDLAAGTTGGSEGVDSIALETIENVIAASCGARARHSIAGDDRRNVLKAADGEDDIRGRGGNDLIHSGKRRTNDCRPQDLGDKVLGGAGDDVIRTDAGDDILEGGAGRDRGRAGRGTDACGSIEVARSCEVDQ